MSKPLTARVRDMYAAYCRDGESLQSVADAFGLSKNGVWMTFNRYGLQMRFMAPKDREAVAFIPPASERRWCEQCQRRVSFLEAGLCRSRWCSAKEGVAA